ncbi:hypothetical protein BI364_11305 [Acidihalobacter yilgarnensis]|uniref:Flagellar protein FliL n=1 Tax=Acidihalobacter yilgarnensis TaxID=2819280 RepID=A0A1D8IPS4_9GAMM|nr:flagellar basal body-associated FliL family protein [Acidihalobacter yilgarnensis]AOU98463.1 hypothetical protein BI364_11305 [Acidihalobacter yilgarnensis]
MAEEAQPAKGGSKTKLIVIISVIVLLVLGLGIGATLFLTGAFSHKADKADKAHTEAPAPKKPAIYMSIEPALVVNLGPDQPVRFLQIGIDVMAREQKVIDAVKENMPAIRNRLISLLSGQKYAVVSTPDGKETLRKQVLASINEVLKAAGDQHLVEQVYFTNFVMQ